MVTTPKGINYVHIDRPHPISRLIRGELETSETYKKDLETMRDELGCNAVRITTNNPELAIEIGKISLESGVTPWLSPRFNGENFETTLQKFGNYVKTCVKDGIDDCPLVVGNELTFDCSDAVKTNETDTTKRHKEIHELLKKGVRPDVTSMVKKLVRSARENGWKGPLVYASFAYELVEWESIEDDNLIVGANLYWERDFSTNEAKDPVHYEQKINNLIEAAGNRKVVITEFGATPHEDTLAFGGGSFALRGEVNYDAQSNAIKAYLDVIGKYPQVGFFLYSFNDRNPFREASYAISEKKRVSLLKASNGILTPAAHRFAEFNRKRGNTPHGIDIEVA